MKEIAYFFLNPDKYTCQTWEVNKIQTPWFKMEMNNLNGIKLQKYCHEKTNHITKDF